MIKKIVRILIMIIIILLFSSLITNVHAIDWVDAGNRYTYQRDWEECNTNHNLGKNIYCAKYKVKKFSETTAKWLHLATVKKFTMKKIKNNPTIDIHDRGVYCGQHAESIFSDQGEYYTGWYIDILGDNKGISVTDVKKESDKNGKKAVEGVDEMAFMITNLQNDIKNVEKIKNNVVNHYQFMPSQYGVWHYAKTFFENLNKAGFFDYKYTDEEFNWQNYFNKYIEPSTKINDAQKAQFKSYIKRIIKIADAYGTFKREYKEPTNLTNENNLQIFLKDDRIICGPMKIRYNEKSVTYSVVNNKGETEAEKKTEYFAGLIKKDTKVLDDKRNPITDYKFCDVNGNEITIKSNKEFYISLPKDTNGITSIQFSCKEIDAECSFCTFISGSGNQMQLFVTDAQRNYLYKDIYISLRIPSFKWILEVHKFDTDEKQRNPSLFYSELEDVAFKIKNNVTGKYIRVNNANQFKNANEIEPTNIEISSYAEYADKNLGTTFLTNKYGRVSIGKLYLGKYTLEEIGTGKEYGYTVLAAPTNIDMTKTIIDGVSYVYNSDGICYTSYVKEIINQKHTGNFIITKQDKDRPEVKIPNVEFKIKNSSNQYLILNGLEGKSVRGQILVENVKTTNVKENGTTLITDDRGNFGVFNILEGEYLLEEISVGSNDRYKLKQELTKIKVTRRKSYNTNNTTYNTYRYEYNTTEADKFTIENELGYIKLSGRVWEDTAFVLDSAKSTTMNNLYQDASRDIDNSKIAGMPVRLKDKNGNIVKNAKGQDCATVTKADGTYEFDYVDSGELKNYKVEFEYNGMKYEPVNVYYDNSRLQDYYYKTKKDKSSKATDPAEPANPSNIKDKTRAKLNQVYGTITSELELESKIKYTDEKYASRVTYQKPEYYNKDELYNIVADTDSGGYNLGEHYEADKVYDSVNGCIIMKDINFGIREREQPDIAVGNDIESVRVSINGKTHIYKYEGRELNIVDEDSAYKLPQSVKFSKKEEDYGGMTYERAVYASDVLYADHKGNLATEEDKLKVEVIYKIGLVSQSANLDVTINKLDEYYDKKYMDNTPTNKNIVAGYELEQEGENKGKVKNQIEVGLSTRENNQFNKVILTPSDLTIEHQKSRQIYVMLEVNPDALKDVVTIGEGRDSDLSKLKYDSIVEITSYTTKKDGKVRAGIDVDSRPENADIEKIIDPDSVKRTEPTTYEDDTDRAPGFILQLNTPRETNGIVFIDNVEKPEGVENTKDLMTNEERRGDGIYDDSGEDGEEKINKEVTVELVYKDKDGKEKVADVYVQGENGETGHWESSRKTFNNGEYKIGGFIPGNYQIKFTWGDGTYKVQEYKGTIYEDKERENDNQWYKSTEPRYSDAIDNYETRTAIDEQTKSVTNGNKELIPKAYETPNTKIQVGDQEQEIITKMDSYTPIMNVRLEYGDKEDIFKEEIEEENKNANREYKINNVDFGIIERPRQEIGLEKHVTGVILKLANGATLVDAKVVQDDDGNYRLEDEATYAVYLPKENGTKSRLKIEVDKEIVQGATLETHYNFAVQNISEIDYVNENYYKYGEKGSYDELVKLTPKQIVEYLDNQSSINEEPKDGWTLQEYQELIDKKLLSGDDELKNYLKNVERIYTIELEEEPLAPGERLKNQEIVFNTSKILSSDQNLQIGNDAEIIELTKTGGSSIVSTPGNYNPTKEETYEPDSAYAEELIVTGPTGENRNYISFIIIGLVSLGIILVGTIIIKKKVLK